jgi:hypothetical protein
MPMSQTFLVATPQPLDRGWWASNWPRSQEAILVSEQHILIAQCVIKNQNGDLHRALAETRPEKHQHILQDETYTIFLVCRTQMISAMKKTASSVDSVPISSRDAY